MKTIYEEAKEELLKTTWNGNELTYPAKTMKTLELAKKEHELLELYQLRDNYQSHTNEYHKIQKGIKTLEKELEILK